MNILVTNILLPSAGIAALVLLGVNLMGMPPRHRTPWTGRGGARRATSIRGMLAGLPRDAADSPGAFCAQLTASLANRFQHGYGRYTIWSNYACWLGGLLLPEIREIHTTPALLRHSQTALCGQIAQAFVDIATRAGVRARIVSLDGHVVAEAYYDHQWRGFDPDYNVVYRAASEDGAENEDGRLVSVEQLADSPLLARQAYQRHRLPRGNDEVLEILARRRLRYLPAGAHAVPRIALLQRVLTWVKWLLPVALALCWWTGGLL